MNRTPVLIGTALLGLAAAPAASAQDGAAAPAGESVLAAPESAQRATASPPRLVRAIEEYRRSGHAATLHAATPGEFTLYPYGHARPLLRCAALRICVVELEAGEVLRDRPLTGDPVRWDVDHTASGGEAERVHVLVRPKQCETSTNLVIATSRRRYVVEVEVPPCPAGSTDPRSDYMAGISFYYPDDEEGVAVEPLADYGIDPLRVNSAYRWDSNRNVAWTPVRIFDDGIRTFIRLPPEARHGEMPLVYLVGADGRRELLNSVVRPDPGGDFLVLDRVLGRAVLIATSGRTEHRVRITNRTAHRSPAP